MNIHRVVKQIHSCNGYVKREGSFVHCIQNSVISIRKHNMEIRELAMVLGTYKAEDQKTRKFNIDVTIIN